MRNLKKILALVLALVMSLSLMATAGATDFKDDENISDTYRQAAQVLFELGVFNGDQNGQFNPDQPIKRSEVAAILYRIATGDIGLEGNKTYAPYNQFPDVTAEDWYAGYVTYCANAGYIKGRNTGKFDAKDNVTGYEVLAMILRAVGYDKNNEFVGSDWQLHTASIAREKGVLRNVLEDPNVQLSQPATREVVAELLFRASLLPQVTWNAATLSYVENGETLAYENLGMEQIEGVVVANEWANINPDKDGGDSVIAAGTTQLKLANGTLRTLKIPSDLTDIGESRYAYVVGQNVLGGQLEDTSKNVTKDCADQEIPGKAIKVADLSSGLNTRDAEYFVNFSDRPDDVSEYRIEYSVSFRNDTAKEWFETEYLDQYANADPDDYELEEEADWENEYYDRTEVNELKYSGKYYDETSDTTKEETKLGLTFTRVIPAGEKITDLDKKIMNGIFSSAASFDSTHDSFIDLSKDIVHTGYVYVGTKSNPNTADRKDDLSDDMTYAQFAEQYIGTDATVYFAASTNGGWLKVVDNNGDGNAEYVFLTVYGLAEVTEYNDRLDAYYFSNGYDTEDWDYALRDSEYEFAIGDMLLMAYIDGQWVIEEAESEVLTIEKYSWKDVTVTTTDGRVLEGSGINVGNGTEYDDILANIPYNTQYEVFYDHYGFIRAFRALDSDRHYGLLTDLYLTDHRNTHYIDSQTATVELSFLDESGKLDMKEYDVSNHSKATPNVFVGVEQVVPIGVNQTDNLQRALAHLGLIGNNTNGWWTDGRTSASDSKYENSTLGWEFDYDHDTDSVGKIQDTEDTSAKNNNTNDTDPAVNTDTNITYTDTNVARYTLNEDGTVTLNTAAEFAYNKAGEQLFYQNVAGVGKARNTIAGWKAAYEELNGANSWGTAQENALVPVYAVDYVMLDTTVLTGSSAISSGSYRFKIDASYSDAAIGNDGNLNNWHVNTVNDTVFYIVTPSGVYPYVGYRNLPTISGADGNIKAAYAVAQNVTQDNAGSDYWVADVVVIELKNNLQGVYSHMIYNVYDNYRAGQKAIVHELEAIDCVTGEVVSVVVDSSWNQAYPNGFYLLSEAEVASDGSISAKGMVTVESRITDGAGNWTGDYADYGIHAGEIVRSSNIEDRGSYIEVFDETDDDNEQGDEIYVPLNGAPWYEVYAPTYAESQKAAGRLYTEKLVNKDYDKIKPNGHEVIYVTNSRNQVVFLIDTSFQEDGWTPLYLNEGIVRTEEGAKVYTDKGVYNDAMNQQSYEAPIIPSEKEFTITFKVASAVGTLTQDQEVHTVKADKGENVLVPMEDLEQAGLKITTIVDEDTNAIANDGTNYVIPNVQGNMDITVTYAIDEYELTIVTTGAATITATNVNGTQYDGSSKPSIGAGVEYTVSFAATANYSYAYTTATNSTPTPITVTSASGGGLTGSFTVRMPKAAETITITQAAIPALNFEYGTGVGSAAANGTTAQIQNLPANVYPGDAVELTVVVAANHTAISVTWEQVGGGSGAATLDETDNKWKIAAGAITGDGDVFINVVVVPETADVTVSKETGYTGNIQVSYTDGSDDAQTGSNPAAAVTVKTGTDVKIVAVSGNITVSITETTGYTTIEGNGTGTVTIKNVTDDLTVKVDAATATD